MIGPILTKYATALTATAAGSTVVRFDLFQAGTNSRATGAHWTPAAGDVKVSIDGAAEANVNNPTTNPAYANGAWELTLTGAELTGKEIKVNIDDAAVGFESVVLRTFGHASAMYPTVYSGGAAGNLITSGTGADQIQVDGAGGIAHVVLVDGVTLADRVTLVDLVTETTDVTNTVTANVTTLGGVGYIDAINGILDGNTTLVGIPAAVWARLTSGMTTVGSIGKKLADWVVNTLTPAERTAIRTEVDANSTRLAAIDAKTTNLPASPATEASASAAASSAATAATQAASAATSAASADTKGTAIKAKTDQLTFTTPGLVDSSATVSGGGDAAESSVQKVLRILQAQD